MSETLPRVSLHLRRPDWLTTPDGAPRGYIQPPTLDELWFHTGTVCNLSCSFCLEGSHPGDNRLEQLRFSDAAPFILEGKELGVKQFSFTGGEPFVNRDLPLILGFALDYAPCMVLTNGTKPLVRRMDELAPLAHKPHPLRFRISLDHPDPAKHDAERGAGNFELSLATLAELNRMGFGVSIARLAQPNEVPEEISAAYRAHFERAGVPVDTHIHEFPDFHPPHASPNVPAITESCMTTYKDEAGRAAFMCNSSKMIVKRDGKARVYACTLVDDDIDYELGSTLRESMQYRIMLKHHRCYACFASGATCSER